MDPRAALTSVRTRRGLTALVAVGALVVSACSAPAARSESAAATTTAPVVDAAAGPEPGVGAGLRPNGPPGPATIHEDGWSTPVKLGFNDDGWEDSPYITRDGTEIIFFYHPWPDLITTAEQLTELVVSDPEAAVAQGLDGGLYVSRRPFETRSVHPLSDNDSPATECCAYVSESGDLFYNSTLRSWELGKGVPETVYRNTERLDFGTGAEEVNPHYVEARDEMWFDCPGDATLCVMRNAAASGFSGEVVVAPYPVNARDVEGVQDSQAFLTDDGNTLYITSDRDTPGVPAIYRLRRLDQLGEEWSEPELFISAPEAVAEVSITADGNELVFAQIFIHDDGSPGLDIYYSHRED